MQIHSNKSWQSALHILIFRILFYFKSNMLEYRFRMKIAPLNQYFSRYLFTQSADCKDQQHWEYKISMTFSKGSMIKCRLHCQFQYSLPLNIIITYQSLTHKWGIVEETLPIRYISIVAVLVCTCEWKKNIWIKTPFLFITNLFNLQQPKSKP